jgi:hypothetical protein
MNAASHSGRRGGSAAEGTLAAIVIDQELLYTQP